MRTGSDLCGIHCATLEKFGSQCLVTDNHEFPWLNTKRRGRESETFLEYVESVFSKFLGAISDFGRIAMIELDEMRMHSGESTHKVPSLY